MDVYTRYCLKQTNIKKGQKMSENSIDTARKATPKSLVKCVETAFRIKRSIMIMGQPGVGKSQIIAQIANRSNRPVIDMRLAQFDSTDIRGVPYFDPETKKMEWAEPSTLPTNEKLANAIIFLDELNTAPPLVQSAAYQLVLDRKLGDYELPPGVDIVAAGNRTEDRGATFDMAMPLRNRFIFVNLEVNFEEWQEWAIENGLAREVIAYLMHRKSHLNTFDEALKNESYSFATPRSWEVVSDILLKGEADNETLDLMVAGAVGDGIANEFVVHMEYISSLPTPRQILEGNYDKNLKIEKQSAFYSLTYGAVLEMIEQYDKDKKETGIGNTNTSVMFDNLYEFCEKFCTSEMTFFTVSSLIRRWRAKYMTAANREQIVPPQNKNFAKFITEYGPMLGLA